MSQAKKSALWVVETPVEQSALAFPVAPVLEERAGVLVDARWCSDAHRRHFGYDPILGRQICGACFGGGYPIRPSGRCYVCKQYAWYERPAHLGAGYICGACHPPVDGRIVVSLGPCQQCQEAEASQMIGSQALCAACALLMEEAS